VAAVAVAAADADIPPARRSLDNGPSAAQRSSGNPYSSPSDSAQASIASWSPSTRHRFA